VELDNTMQDNENAQTAPAPTEQQTLGTLAATGKNDHEQSPADLLKMLSDEQAAHRATLAAYMQQIKDSDDLIPEMIGGSTLTEVDASRDASRAAYQRLATKFAPAGSTSQPTAPLQAELENPTKGTMVSGQNAQGQPITPPDPDQAQKPSTRTVGNRRVPAGGAQRRGDVTDTGKMSATEKIRYGLETTARS
jgi:hypothetical protein